MVGSLLGWKSSFTKRSTREDWWRKVSRVSAESVSTMARSSRGLVAHLSYGRFTKKHELDAAARFWRCGASLVAHRGLLI